MKSVHVYLVVICVLTLFIVFTEKSMALDLQSEIDTAEDGDVIVIPAGEYAGPITIQKSLTLQGDGNVTLVSESDVTLFIESDEVKVDGITVLHNNPQLDSKALLLRGSRNQISNVTVHTRGMGIVLENANENVLQNIRIEGAFQDSDFTGSMLTREGNGIDLFQSNDNLIENVEIRYAQDGIYVEQGTGNTIQDSYVAHSRYGFHFMFTQQSSVFRNLSEENIAGAMVMGTVGTHLEDNIFRKQRFHVHSQGLMLYDVHDARVLNNVMEENLIGLFLESAIDNEIEHNEVSANYIGLEVLRSEGNVLSNNNFVNNQIPARAKDSHDNFVYRNYWDSHYGLDVTGERVSVIPYEADVLFPSLIANKPAFQLFADSPGLFFMQFVLDMDRSEALTDEAPLMEASSQSTDLVPIERNSKDVMLCSFALIASLFTMYVGGRKK